MDAFTIVTIICNIIMTTCGAVKAVRDERVMKEFTSKQINHYIRREMSKRYRRRRR